MLPGSQPANHIIVRHALAVTATSVTPDVLVDADPPNTVEPGRIIDQESASFVEDGVIRRVPGHAKARGDAGDGEMVKHDALQRPPHPTTRQLRPLCRGRGEVFAPGAPAASALVAAHADQQRRGAVPERLMREQARARPARQRLAAGAQALSSPGFDRELVIWR